MSGLKGADLLLNRSSLKPSHRRGRCSPRCHLLARSIRSNRIQCPSSIVGHWRPCAPHQTAVMITATSKAQTMKPWCRDQRQAHTQAVHRHTTESLLVVRSSTKSLWGASFREQETVSYYFRKLFAPRESRVLIISPADHQIPPC